MKNHKARVMLVTGASSGLGLATADLLCRNGYKVYGLARTADPKLSNGNLNFMVCDVTDENAVKNAVKTIFETESAIHGLINFAGIGIAGAIEETPVEAIRQVFEINYLGTVRMIQAVVPVMRLNHEGIIINVSSIAGKLGLPFQSVYSSSKHAIEALTESLWIELRPFHIQVCLIEPGDYKTEVNNSRIRVIPGDDSSYQQRLQGFYNLLNRNIQNGRDPNYIAGLVLKIVKKKNPRLRYKSGRLLEVITPAVKSILPWKIFAIALHKFYKLK